MSQPVIIPYDSPSAIRYDVDPDGTLHITIPAQGLRGFGIKSHSGGIVYIVFLVCCTIAPAVGTGIFWWIRRDPNLLPMFMLAIVVTPIILLLLWLTMVIITRERIWIDATPAGITVRQQMFKAPSRRFFPRDRIRALELCQDTEDMHWVIRLHGRFEAELFLTNRPEADLRKIAERLRAVLCVPEKPPP